MRRNKSDSSLAADIIVAIILLFIILTIYGVLD